MNDEKNPIPTPDDTSAAEALSITSEEEKKKLLERIKEMFAKLFKWAKQKKMPTVFEQKITNIQKQMDALAEQDDIQNDCLRDVADALERVTGVLEGGGELKNAEKEAVEQKLDDVEKAIAKIKELGVSHYTVTKSTLESALQQAFGERAKGIYTENDKGERVLSPNVHIYLDKNKEGKADVYLALMDENGKAHAVKVDITKTDRGLEKVRMEHAHVNITSTGNAVIVGSAGKLEEIPITDDTKSMALQSVLGDAFFQSTMEYLEKRKAKGEELYAALMDISGTEDNPYVKDNFHCIDSEELGYVIKDRSTNSMIALRREDEGRALCAYFYPDVDGFKPTTKPIEALRLERTETGTPRYRFATSPNADAILDSPMAKRYFELQGINVEALDKVRSPYIEKTGGELVEGATATRKIITLRNELENFFKNSTGVEGYDVSVLKKRGRETQFVITTPEKSQFVANFNKNGDVKTMLWREMNEDGKLGKTIPVVKHENNKKVKKVLDKMPFHHTDFCMCYTAIDNCMTNILQRENANNQKDFSYGVDMSLNADTKRQIENSANVKAWANLAAAAIRANGSVDRLDDNLLVNLICEEVENQTGKYPSKEFREGVRDKAFYIYGELSDSGVIDDIYSKIVTGHEPYDRRDENNGKVVEVIGVSKKEQEQGQSKDEPVMQAAHEAADEYNDAFSMPADVTDNAAYDGGDESFPFVDEPPVGDDDAPFIDENGVAYDPITPEIMAEANELFRDYPDEPPAFVDDARFDSEPRIENEPRETGTKVDDNKAVDTKGKADGKPVEPKKNKGIDRD